MLETIIGLIATASLGMATWAVTQIIKVPNLEEKVDHLVRRVDALYDHLLGDKS
jgi:hypothetical protein